MKILMLGWEYPPHISGGLGIACDGLTRALARQGANIDFFIPKLMGGENANHMQLRDPAQLVNVDGTDIEMSKEDENITTWGVPAFLAPYLTAESYDKLINNQETLATLGLSFLEGQFLASLNLKGKDHYGKNLFLEVDRFAKLIALLAKKCEFDVIHAHDWMTYPAGIVVKRLTGKPLILHAHSIEMDRSGDVGADERIKTIEGAGFREANTVIAVSYFTRDRIAEKYGINPDKIAVVHNGIFPKEVQDRPQKSIDRSKKYVLFMGRITFQKGPEYFVEAARRVIPHVPNVVFVMGGSGDMLPAIMQKVRDLGMEKHFLFTGFLRGPQVEEIYAMADLYVMPSVSEPFGLSALEAISADTPALISRQSGVSEVITHALKADFWDVEELADLIIGALLHPELRRDIMTMAREEVNRLNWDCAATKTMGIYRSLLGR